MSQEPQGLVKYECFMCSKQFIVGMLDEEQAQLQNRAIRCPFCGFAADSLAFIEYEAIERAINVEAEAEVERLQTELAQLRKVVDAARVLSDIWSVGGKPNLSNLRYALAELDKIVKKGGM